MKIYFNCGATASRPALKEIGNETSSIQIEIYRCPAWYFAWSGGNHFGKGFYTEGPNNKILRVATNHYDNDCLEITKICDDWLLSQIGPSGGVILPFDHDLHENSPKSLRFSIPDWKRHVSSTKEERTARWLERKFLFGWLRDCVKGVELLLNDETLLDNGELGRKEGLSNEHFILTSSLSLRNGDLKKVEQELARDPENATLVSTLSIIKQNMENTKKNLFRNKKLIAEFEAKNPTHKVWV